MKYYKKPSVISPSSVISFAPAIIAVATAVAAVTEAVSALSDKNKIVNEPPISALPPVENN